MAAPGEFDIKKLLSSAHRFPDAQAAARLSRLVGVERRVEQLVGDLHLIFNPVLAREWAQEHHGDQLVQLLGLLDDMVPLLVFEGDVGTGKSVVAETIGDALARTHGYDVLMFKLSTQVRGTGYVGEMGTMLAAAFDNVVTQWRKHSTPIILVIDEADSILTTRAATDHHHEDKSGVNTILQHLDGLRVSDAQVAVIAITNRVGVLDPAVMRRATVVQTFDRPTREERRALFERLLVGVRLPPGSIDRLVEASEPRCSPDSNDRVPLSWSDLTIRLLVPTLRNAIRCDTPLSAEVVIQHLNELAPSSVLKG